MRFAVGVVIVAMLGYFYFAVPFADRTLWEYSVLVFSTPEAGEAGDGIKRGAEEYIDEAVDKAREAATATAAPRAEPEVESAPDRAPVGKPMDDHRPEEKHALRKILSNDP